MNTKELLINLMEIVEMITIVEIVEMITMMIMHQGILVGIDQVQRFRIFGLACNHTMSQSPCVDRSAIWFGFMHFHVLSFS